MTPEQSEQFKAMSFEAVLAKYIKKLSNGEITKEQYLGAISLYRQLNNDPVVKNWDASEEEVRELEKQFNTQKGTSQKERLYKLLSDGNWHRTDEIQEVVYGRNHLGVARISARVQDLKNDGYEIESELDSGNIWKYKLSSSQQS
jgi:biotin operon repressor